MAVGHNIAGKTRNLAPQRPPAALTHRRKIQPQGKQNHHRRWDPNPTRFLYELVDIPSKISPYIHCSILDYRTSTIVSTVGTNGTKKITGKPNTNTEDKIDDIPIDVETPVKDITINHHTHLREHQEAIVEKL